MNSRSLLFARYQSSSPSALKILPFFSVWLRRALGFESLSRTLLSSLVPPRAAWLRTLLLTSLPTAVYPRVAYAVEFQPGLFGLFGRPCMRSEGKPL